MCYGCTNLAQISIVNLILLKAMTNLPHTDFLLCKCLLTQDRVFNVIISIELFGSNFLFAVRRTASEQSNGPS